MPGYSQDYAGYPYDVEGAKKLLAEAKADGVPVDTQIRLIARTARAAAVEATACGLHWTFAPTLDIARDQRWGRGAEGAGEDVVLGCAFAAARVAWMQVRKHYPELAEMDAGELMEYQAVEYYRLQEDRKRYFESQGRDASNVLPGWPMLG